MKYIIICLSLFSLIHQSRLAAQIIDIGQCPPPQFASQEANLDPVTYDYLLDAIDEFQSQFGVAPVSRTNMFWGLWQIGDSQCAAGKWYVRIRYEGGAAFLPAPLGTFCSDPPQPLSGCWNGFLYDGEQLFQWDLTFVPASQVPAIEQAAAANEKQFNQIVSKHRAKKLKRRIAL